MIVLALAACRAVPAPAPPEAPPALVDSGADTGVTEPPCGTFDEVALGDVEEVVTGEAGVAAGNALAVGDVDGDGIGDVLVGAEWTEYPNGAADLVRGPVTAGSLADADLVVAGTGSYWDSQFGGFSVALVDLDGDGLDDVASGEPGPGVNYSGAGSVAVVRGLRTGTATADDYDGELLGEYDEDLAGSALAVGDVDGDGGRELLVGAEWYPGGYMFGRVYVVHPPVVGAVALADAWATLTGPDEAVRAGQALAAGDLDGDGADDVVVGAAGRVYGILGIAAGDTQLVDAALRIDGDPLGAGMAVGDLDGDGVADLVLGAPGVGAVAVFQGPVVGRLTLADARVTIAGEDPVSDFGASIRVVDAAALLVGAPGSDEVWLLCPPTSGTVEALDVARVHAQGALGSEAGFALAVGEVTGDDAVDLLVGAPTDDAGGPDAGAVVLLSYGS